MLGPWLYDFILSGVQQPNALRYINDHSSEYNSSEHNDSDEVDGTFSWSSSDMKEADSFVWSDPQTDYSVTENTEMASLW